MSEVTTVPVILLSIIIVLSVIGASLASIIMAALTRITRSQAAEAQADQKGGKHIARIVDRRPAAQAMTSGIRSLIVVVLGASLAVLLGMLIHNFWLHMLAVIVVAALLLLLGYTLMPPSIGYKYPVRMIRLGGGMLWLLTKVGAVFITRRDHQDDDEHEHASEDRLAVMVEHVSESEALEDDERDLLNSVFELSRTMVREVMVPRTDMIAITVDENLDKAMSLFTRSGYSRVPVIGENSDDIQGVIYLKDIIRRIHHRSGTEDLLVSDVMREAVFIPETKMVDDLLAEMRRDAVHIALVVDEYGGIAGLVTIEDLLEELVGEMVDEHDRAEPEVEELSDGTFRIPARMPIDDLAELFEIMIEEDDVDTAGGLFTKALGRIPIVGSEANTWGLHLAADRFEGRRKRLSTMIATRAVEVELEEDE